MGSMKSHWETKKYSRRKICDDKKRGQGDAMLLALKLEEGGHLPRNVGSLYSLNFTKKQILT